MLEYNGIKLKPIEIEDLQILNRWKNDEEIFKYLGGGFRPTSMTQQKKWVEKMTENTSEEQRFIILNEEEKKIGFIGLYNISPVNRTCLLGIYIGEKEYWGQGIASRAYIALERYAKQYINIRKIKLDVVKKNVNAIKMYEKLGFSICGEYEKERYIDGEYQNIILMEKFI